MQRPSRPATARAPSAGTPTIALALADASGADELDRRLHAERGRTHRQDADELPDGAFVLVDEEPWLVLGRELLRWAPGGYAARRSRRGGRVEVVTPPTTLRVLAAGWRGSEPFVHPTGAG